MRYTIGLAAVLAALAGALATDARADFSSANKVIACGSMKSLPRYCQEARCAKVGLCGGPFVYAPDGCLSWICTKLGRGPVFR